MSKTLRAFSVLQAIAAVASLAIIFWSLGLPNLQFAEAANVTNLSDTLSSSRPSVAANHTIEFTTPSGVAAGESITVAFPTGFTGVSSLTFGDVDLNIAGTEATLAATPSGATWGVNILAQSVIFTSDTGVVNAGETVTIEIGTNANGGTNQITNPSTIGSQIIDLTVGSEDSGQLRVAIVDSVTVSATIDTVFTFGVNQVDFGTTIGSIATTSATSTRTTVEFGQLSPGSSKIAAQELTVETNSANGFVVTVQADQQLTSGNGADIDSFVDGADTSTPQSWNSPSEDITNENTWGHWGLSSTDITLGSGLTDIYNGGAHFVAASTTGGVEVFRHNDPTDGTVDGEGVTNVLYQVEVSSLQEAADDYTATLTYVATPVF